MTERHDNDVLDRQLAALEREIKADRDLWPGIASRVGPRRAAAAPRRWLWRLDQWIPAGVALAAGYVLASWFPMPWTPAFVAPEAQPAQRSTALLVSVQPALAQLPANTRAVVETDLSGLAQDWLSIEEALALDPDNDLLRELQQTAESRASSVREYMNRVTATVSEAVEI